MSDTTDMSGSQPSDETLDHLSAMIDGANNIAFFTGAGISTESGIPDFRSPGTGLWNKIKPIDFEEFKKVINPNGALLAEHATAATLLAQEGDSDDEGGDEEHNEAGDYGYGEGDDGDDAGDEEKPGDDDGEGDGDDAGDDDEDLAQVARHPKIRK